MLGLVSVAAIVLGVMIWSGHRNENSEQAYQTSVLQAAADWTSVLINMNADTVDTSLRTLHDGTVGQLNADFETTVEPFKQLVLKLKSKTAGQVDSVSIESLHHQLPGPSGAPAPQPELSTVASRTDTVLVVATSVSQNASGAQPQTGAVEPAARRLRRRRQAADLAAGDPPMRNRLRAIAFDVLAPLAAIAGLVYIGLALAWPVWWVAVCSVLCLLIVQAVIVDFVLYRRDGVTVGTDDEGPGLRLAVVGLAAVALVAAVAVGYTRWTVPDRTMHDDMAAVVGIASSVAEASATFTPQDPNASIDRATGLMTPERADAYRNEFASVAKELGSKNISGQASTISAGVEAIGPAAASVAVVMRGTQNAPGKPVDVAVLALRITLTKDSGKWLVVDVTPINAR